MENREKLNRHAIDGNIAALERELLAMPTAIRDLLAARLRSRLAEKLAERLSPRRRRHP